MAAMQGFPRNRQRIPVAWRGGLGDTVPVATAPTASASSGLVDTVEKLLPAFIQARYQDKVLSENLAREKAGLKPLDTEAYKPGVTVGLDPQTRTILWWVGGGTVALGAIGLYLSQRKKSKGRK